MKLKKTLRIIGVIVLSPVVLLLSVAVLLFVPPIQNWAVKVAADIVSEQTGMDVSVGHVRLSFPIDLLLQDVVAVQQGDTLADVGRLKTSVQLPPLLKGMVVVDELELSDTRLNTLDLISDLQIKGKVGRLSVASRGIDLNRGIIELNGTTMSDADVTVLLSDTAAVDTTTSETALLFRVDSLTIERSNVEVHLPGDSTCVKASMGLLQAREGVIDLLAGRYTVGALTWTDGTFSYDDGPLLPIGAGSRGMDYSHIALNRIALGIDSFAYHAPDLTFKVSNAAMRERSGLEITSLQGAMQMDSVSLRLPRLHLTTPYSNLRARVDMDFGLLDSLSTGHSELTLDAIAGKHDLMVFLADLGDDLPAHWPDWPLSVQARMKGNLQKADVVQMDLTLPTALQLQAKGKAGLPLKADLDVVADGYDLSFLKAFVPALGKDILLPKGLHLQGNLQTHGDYYAADVELNDGQGVACVNGHFDAKSMSYDADIFASELDLSHFLPDMGLGLLSAKATASGMGTDFLKKTSWMEADASIQHLSYAELDMDSLQASVRLNDGHATGHLTGHNRLFDGSVTADALLDTRQLQATIGADLSRVDMQALKLDEQKLAIGFCGHLDLTSDLEERHHVAGTFSELYIRDSLRTYRPGDISLLLNTSRDTTVARLESGDLKMKIDASGSLENLLGQLTTLADTISSQIDMRIIDQQKVKDLLPTMQLYASSGKDNPIANYLRSTANIDFRELLVDFTASPQKGLNGTTHLYRVNLDSTLLDTIRVDLVEKKHGLTFNGQVTNNRRNPQLVFNALFDGHLQEHGASIGMRFFDQEKLLGLRLGMQASMVDNGINFHLIPKRPTLGYKEFTLNDDNFLLLQNNMRLKANVDLMADDGTGIKIYSEDQDASLLQDLTVSLHQLNLGQITEALPYAPQVTGEMNGDFHLIMDHERKISLLSDMYVKHMTYEGSEMGNVGTEFVYLQREDDTHALEGLLTIGQREVANIRGEYQNKDEGRLNADVQLKRFPLEVANGFIPDQLIGFEGYAEGEMKMQGKSSNLDVDGEVYLDSAALISQPYGIRLRFDNDPVRIQNGKLLLENFTMYAYNNEPLNIMGNLDFHNTSQLALDLRMRARNYQIINSKQTTKSVAWGKAFVNIFATLQGPLDQLNMRGRLDVLGKTDLNYILLDSPLSTDNQMEELVKFTDFNDSTKITVSKPAPSGLNMSLTMSIDQGAHVRCALNVDQTNYVNLSGGGDLRLKYTNDGLALTGRYTIGSGDMKYSLPIIPLKTFTIEEGSYVEFNGPVGNPKLNITATERTRATVGQEAQSRSVIFDCGVCITKTLNDMGLEFIISAPEDNIISSELSSMTKEERSQLAVSMLTTGMYLSDGNTNGFSMNSALSSFLQSEINSITGNALKTLDLSIGLDNTTDATGNMHTDYSFKFAKRFWDNRLKVQIGGKVSTGSDVKAEQQSFFDNVTMEYRLSATSNKYVKLFYNQNVYDWLDGYTAEYGGGYIWRRRLDKFLDILLFWRKSESAFPGNGRTGRNTGTGQATPRNRDSRTERTDTTSNSK